GLSESDVQILHDHRILPHVQQIDGPEDAPATVSAAHVRRGVRVAAAVAQARLPALVQRHAGVHRRLRRLRQLHPVHPPEPIAIPAGQVGHPGTTFGRVLEGPRLGLTLKPRQAAALPGLVDAADAVAERPAERVVVAWVWRVEVAVFAPGLAVVVRP
ncbi:Os01g0784450, partial [Oryza sativa Japonica Group]